MKLIHLSDLHIGKRVNEVSMIEDQEYILLQILQIIDEEKADAVLIAGDVYDKSVPSAEAVTVFDDFMCSLSRREVPVMIISGNHDSAERLAFGTDYPVWDPVRETELFLALDLTEEQKEQIAHKTAERFLNL